MLFSQMLAYLISQHYPCAEAWLLHICAVMYTQVCVCVTAGLVRAQCYFADPSHLLWVKGIKENPGSALDQ